MLKEDKWNQYGQPLEGIMYGITVHNTNSEKSASELFEWLENENKTSQGCHFLVDEEKVVSVMPLNWCTWHTGKGEDFGNLHTIAIEICRSQSSNELYLAAQENAIDLIAQLMNQYEWNDSNIFFHIDFNERTYCPHRILDVYKTKSNWIKEVLHGNPNVK